MIVLILNNIDTTVNSSIDANSAPAAPTPETVPVQQETAVPEATPVTSSEPIDDPIIKVMMNLINLVLV